MSALRSRPWYVYLLRTRDGTLYTGISTDVAARFLAHARGQGAKFTRGRALEAVVFRCRLGTRSLAAKVEHRIKRLPKVRKEDLIRMAPVRQGLLAQLHLDPPLPPKRTRRTNPGAHGRASR